MVTRAPEIDLRRDYVALPRNYGTPEYFEREDIKAVRETVFRNLEDLDARSGFSAR